MMIVCGIKIINNSSSCVCVCVFGTGISPCITIEHTDGATLIHAEDKAEQRYSAMQAPNNAAFSPPRKIEKAPSIQ